MTYDMDVYEKLSVDERDALVRMVRATLWHVDHLKTKLDEWGFDNRPLDQSDSFTIIKLVQFKADLLYILEEMKKVEEERRTEDE